MEPYDDLTDLEPGMVLAGRYEILEELGEGGFGIVYRARQLATEQTVAIKVLSIRARDKASMEKLLARFHREMRLCGQLHHPNIMRLIDFGQSALGQPFTVFEFAPGKSLAQVLFEERTLDLREAQHLMLQVLDALACAHAKGVVHRDLKPSNIMVIPTGARRNALVLDFGIGAVTEGEGIEGYSRITTTNEVLGTPSYAAPEQLRGSPPSPRSDLFSWALILMECITGQRVVTGASLMAAIAQQLGSAPIPIPPSLEAHPLGEILRQALVKDVHAREVTARGLFRELDACTLAPLPSTRARGTEVGGAPSSPEERTVTVMSEGDGFVSSPSAIALCCVLSARTTLGKSKGLAGLASLLRAGLLRCVELVGSHGGRVGAMLGDRALFLFGYPMPGQDDAQRAARAACAIVASASGTRDAEPLAALVVRIGIESGPVTLGSLDQIQGNAIGVVGGVAPLIATHIAPMPRIGPIAVGPGAHPLLHDGFVLSSVGPLRINGLPNAMEVFALEEYRRLERAE